MSHITPSAPNQPIELPKNEADRISSYYSIFYQIACDNCDPDPIEYAVKNLYHSMKSDGYDTTNAMHWLSIIYGWYHVDTTRFVSSLPIWEIN